MNQVTALKKKKKEKKKKDQEEVEENEDEDEGEKKRRGGEKAGKYFSCFAGHTQITLVDEFWPVRQEMPLGHLGRVWGHDAVAGVMFCTLNPLPLLEWRSVDLTRDFAWGLFTSRMWVKKNVMIRLNELLLLMWRQYVRSEE